MSIVNKPAYNSGNTRKKPQIKILTKLNLSNIFEILSFVIRKNKLKRKRTPNFTAEEKLRFVRLLCEEGQCIISKVTAHDATTNKEKEQKWAKITRIHNSSGDMIRTTETLKKQWGKLKSEAKTYKAASRLAAGGGPSKKYDDPVLELVVEITGRASTGITNIEDCDAESEVDPTTENYMLAQASVSVEYLDETEFLQDSDEDKIIPTQVDQIEVEEVIKQSTQESSNEKGKKILNDLTTKEWVNRRRPEISANERTVKMQTQQRITNRFAAERLRAEQEKTNLILQQIKHSTELHCLKMEDEKHKKEILETLLKKYKMLSQRR